MSTLKTNNVQVGQSVTATNNFTLYQPSSPDGTVRLGVGNSGATTADVLVANSSSAVMIGTATQSTGATLTVNGSIKGTITSGTSQASTSGTAITFTGIPSWAKRVTVMLQGVSGSALATVYMQIGSGSLTASGYLGGGTYLPTAAAINANTYWPLEGAALGAASLRNGIFVVANITGNTWVMSGAQSNSNDAGASVANGSLALSGALDRVSIGISAGAFDAGTINILYEG